MSRLQFSRRAARPIAVRRQRSVRLSRAPCQESILENRSNNAKAPDAQQLHVNDRISGHCAPFAAEISCSQAKKYSPFLFDSRRLCSNRPKFMYLISWQQALNTVALPWRCRRRASEPGRFPQEPRVACPESWLYTGACV